MFIKNLIVAVFIFTSVSAVGFEIETKQGDHRKFDALILPNGLRVLLISNPELTKSAASLDVNVGSGEDPFARQGLAHFLEHMLFLGSKKYPKADEYSEFISAHGGTHNAYTSLKNTNFFFDVDAGSFQESLDRFANMFVSPLFSVHYVEREVNAVHSEFTSKYTDEYRRYLDVMRELVNQKHSFSKFSTGNLETLMSGGVKPLVNDLKQFYATHYNAAMMSLVLTGPQSLEQLKKWVAYSFNGIPQGSVSIANDEVDLFPVGFLPKRIVIEPIKESRSLTLMFPVPDSSQYKTKKPTQYIGHLIGHEGKGSLLDVLKREGLATALSAGGKVDWRGGELFSVSISLTEEGFSRIEEIERLFFEAVREIEKAGLQEWRFNELKNIAQMNFHYGEAIDPIHEVMWLSSRMHNTALKKLISEPYTYSDYDEALIARYLNALNENNYLSIVTAPEVKTSNTSKIYHVPYAIKNIHRQSLGASKLAGQFLLPKQNTFIPTDFLIVEDKKKRQKNPKVIYKKDYAEVWYANDNTFNLPKASVKVRFKLPEVAKSPEAFAVASVFSRIIAESLSTLSYDAYVGGVSYSIESNYRGVSLNYSGYSDSLGELSSLVDEQIAQYFWDEKKREALNEKYFEQVYEDLLRKSLNRQKDKPLSKLFADVPSVLYSPYWSTDQVAMAYKKMTYQAYSKEVKKLWDNGYAEVFVFGNLKKRQAKKMAKKTIQVLKQSTGVADKKLPGEVVKLEGKEKMRKIQSDESDTGFVLYAQGHDDTYESRAAMLLLDKVLANPFYSEIRTEQQLGYIVQTSPYSFKKVPGLALIVQSPKYADDIIYQRVHAFFEQFKEKLTDNFERDKQSLISILSEKPKTQAEYSDLFWTDILLDDHAFNDKEKLIEAVKALNTDRLQALYADIFINKNRNVIFVASNAMHSRLSEKIPQIENAMEFKDKMQTYTYP